MKIFNVKTFDLLVGGTRPLLAMRTKLRPGNYHFTYYVREESMRTPTISSITDKMEMTSCWGDILYGVKVQFEV